LPTISSLLAIYIATMINKLPIIINSDNVSPRSITERIIPMIIFNNKAILIVVGEIVLLA
jgi:hypothetical protein